MRWPLFFACFLSFSACLCGACSLAIPPTALHRLSPRAVQVLRRPEPPLSRQEAFAGAADRSGWEQEQERRPSLEAPRAAALDGPPEPPSQHCPRARPVALRTPLSSLPSAGWWCCEQRPTKPTAPLSRAQIYLGNSVTRRRCQDGAAELPAALASYRHPAARGAELHARDHPLVLSSPEQQENLAETSRGLQPRDHRSWDPGVPKRTDCTWRGIWAPCAALA
eukprot:XP_025011140.1 uncharacterized protein LOC101747516 isoform X3 [Gallus gallus]